MSLNTKKELVASYDPYLVEDLIFGANAVLDNWDSGNLAQAVNQLREALEAMDARFELEEENYN